MNLNTTRKNVVVATNPNEVKGIRNDAIRALEMMKALEAKKSKKMKMLRVDDKTIIYATKDRMKHIKQTLKIK